MFAAVSDIAHTYTIHVGTSFGNRHFYLCIWNNQTVSNFCRNQSHIIAHYHAQNEE